MGTVTQEYPALLFIGKVQLVCILPKLPMLNPLTKHIGYLASGLEATWLDCEMKVEED